MIFYFSATGNSKHVAEAIAQATHDEMISIATCMDESRYEFDAADRQVGFVSPVFFWGLPSIVKDFLSRVRIRNASYAFYVTTYGSTTGGSGHMARNLLAKHGLGLDAQLCVKMPDTWTPIFDLSDPSKVAAKDAEAEVQIAEVANLVAQRSTSTSMKTSLPLPIAHIGYAFYGMATHTSHLSVDNSCIGCGLCANKCPVHAIEMCDGRPVWVKGKCTMCLGCLHRCPKFAIQRSSRTRAHGQYTNSHTQV